MLPAHYYEPVTGETYPLDVPRWCSDFQTPLLISHQPGITKEDIDGANRSLWRYRASFPAEIIDPISLGEGCTPLVQRTWGDARPFFKLEWFSPTSSFKDRGTSVMLSYLRQLGITAVLEDSSGNGGASIAGYGAAGRLDVKIICPSFTSPAKLTQIRAYGAEIELVAGPRAMSAGEAIRQSSDIFYASHNWQPFFLQGTKTIGYEIWEDLGFCVPDNIVMPIGAGSNLLGCEIAFKELERSGATKKLPRLFVGQPHNCSPIDASFKAGSDKYVEREVYPTIAEGTVIAHPLRLREIIAAVRSTGGTTIAVSEEEIISAMVRCARHGLFTEPTSAIAVAAFEALNRFGVIKDEQTTVVILTGTGIKASDSFGKFLVDLSG